MTWKLKGLYRVILGFYWDNGKENGSYRDYRGYVDAIKTHQGMQRSLLHAGYLIQGPKP